MGRLRCLMRLASGMVAAGVLFRYRLMLPSLEANNTANDFAVDDALHRFHEHSSTTADDALHRFHENSSTTAVVDVAVKGSKDFSLQGCPLPGSPTHEQASPTDTVVTAWPKPRWQHVVSATGEDHPTNAIRRDKLWEGGLTLLMKWALEVGCSQADCLVVDIGMNVGWYTALSAAHGKNVLAFEPNPAPMAFGKKTVELNGWGPRVQIINGGLSLDRAPLYVEARLQNAGSRSAERSPGGFNSVRVPSHRLDDVIHEGAQICFLKADCQGCEGQAFLSGSKLLGAGNIKVVMLEFDHSQQARHALATLQKLSPRPFHCLLIPLAAQCDGPEMDDPNSASVRQLWDVVVASILENCDVEKIDALAPTKRPPGYYTDLWLTRDDVLAKLQQAPEFVAAQSRLSAAANQSCRYHAVQESVGYCDMLCHTFK